MMRLDENGLVPAIAQNAATGEVLMLGYVTPGSLRRTLEGGDVWFYSRSRADLWHKGEVSGHFMRLKSASIDCDGDAILLKVEPEGPICHTGHPTCFFTPLETLPEAEPFERGPNILEELFSVIQDRKQEMPETSYTAGLFRQGLERICQKVIEEAGETALASAMGDKGRVASEAADLFYHTLVLLAASGATPEDVWAHLRQRRR